MQQQIEDLKKRAEQGSQQVQGEVQELELEAILRQKFPHDAIEAVPKGEFGGDLLQRVFTNVGQECGTILWEAKRTRNWSDGWLTKLRDDQRAAKADVALIVSHALPKGTQSFDLVDGIWVAEPRCAIPVAIAVRQTLIQVAGTRVAGEGQQTKTEMVYNYLIGPRFRHRVEAIVERFTEMQADLDRERKAMTRLWAKREGQIRGVVEATVGMYGDLQGIHAEEVARRIASCFGKEKAGSRIVAAARSALSLAQRRDPDLLSDNGFWFTRGQSDVPPVRDRSAESGATLKASYVSMLEIEAALKIAAADNAGGSDAELVRSAARLLGFRRVGPDLQLRISEGLEARDL